MTRIDETGLKRPFRCRWAVLALVALAALAGLAGAAEVPYLTSRVMDEAGMLTPETERSIDSRLAAFESESGHQVAVLTIPTLGGEPIEDYSMRVVETWQLGRTEADDGVLLLIVRDDRQMRLEVGYGLESELTDMASRRVLDHVIAPRFRQGDFPGGVTAGVEAVIAALEEGESGVERHTVAKRSGGGPDVGGLAGLAIFALFAFQVLCGRGCVRWGIYGVMAAGLVFFAFLLAGTVGAVVAAVVLVVVLPLLSKVLCGAMSRGRSSGGGPWIGGGGGGFSGGGFSGGFSGGGGSFGGGGASSSW